VVSVDYIREAVERVRKGAEKAGKTLDEVDRPELLVCCLSDDDPPAAMMEGKALVAYYLGTEPHIMKASNVAEDLIKKVQEFVGWPATEADYRRAAKLIPDDVVRNLMAVGTSQQCRDKVAEYIEAGVTCPILYPMMDDIKPVIDAFADWEP
jgi:5,10-methylenetetrahydromethanopterin reductase